MLVVCFGLMAVFTPMGSARAVSSADLIIKPVDSLVLRSFDGGSCTIDLTSSWESELRSDLTSEQLASFNNRQAWAVSQGYDSMFDFTPSYVRVLWWDSSNLPATASFTHNALTQSTAHEGLLSIGSGCTVSSYVNMSPYWYGSLAAYDSEYNGEHRYNVRPFLAHGIDINYPVGYEGEYVPSDNTLSYVAMGDSFSSGEGNSPFENGTDTSSNTCHRSIESYPRLLQNDSDLDLGSTAFVACSGATTSNVLNGQENEPAQVNALSTETDVVTITIGGNDVGFRDFATACTASLCNFDTAAYSTIHNKIVNDLPADLEDVYEAIDNATSSTAEVYVIGYPHIAPSLMPTGMGSACWPLNGQADNPDPTKNDGATVYAVVAELNDTIEDAVQSYGSSKFTYVDPNGASSPFVGHDWCQQDRYFHIVTLNQIEHSFHPTVDGQEAYASIIKSVM